MTDIVQRPLCVNLAVKRLVCAGSGWMHTCKKARLHSFHQSTRIDLRQTLNKHRGFSRLLNKRFQLRWLAQRMLLWQPIYGACWQKLTHHVFILWAGVPQQTEGLQSGLLW